MNRTACRTWVWADSVLCTKRRKAVRKNRPATRNPAAAYRIPAWILN